MNTMSPLGSSNALGKKVLSGAHCLISACSAHRAARVWRAIGHITRTAAGFEAAHSLRTRPLACGGGTVALLNSKAGGIESHHLVTIDADLVVWSPAVATASVINFEFKGCW